MRNYQIYYKANGTDCVAQGVKIISAKNSDNAIDFVIDFLLHQELQLVELTCQIY